MCHVKISTLPILWNEIINCPVKVERIHESSKCFEITLRVYGNV